jgi:hypothetical protein
VSNPYQLPNPKLQSKQLKSIPAAKAQAAKVKAAKAVKKAAAKGADIDLPPAAVTIDSDGSWCTDDSAPFPLPLEQLDKYPVEQRKQQQKANRFYNFFERYALEVSEAGAGLCGGSGKGAADVDEGMRNVSIFDDSSVCAEDVSDAAGGTDGAVSTTPEKKVRWDLNATSCNDVDYGDFYDRYMLVVTEVGASCGSKENATEESDQAGARSVPAVALDKKTSPTSTTETDQLDSSKEQVESSQEEGWDVNQVNCMDIDMQPCVGMVKAVPFNLNKFWESLIDKNNFDEDDDVDGEEKVHTRSDRKGNSKRMKARESSTLSREVRYKCSLLLFRITLDHSLSSRVNFTH